MVFNFIFIVQTATATQFLVQRAKPKVLLFGRGSCPSAPWEKVGSPIQLLAIRIPSTTLLRLRAYPRILLGPTLDGDPLPTHTL